MNKRIFFITGSIAALVWSVIMIYFYASGRIGHYIAETFQTQALAGGIVLGIIALFNLINISEKASCGHEHDHVHAHAHDHDHDHDHDCGHDHGHGEGCGHDHSHDDDDELHAHHHEQETTSGMVINYSILIIPVIAAAILTPDEMSAAWARNNMSLATPGEVREDLALTSRKQQTPSKAPSQSARAEEGNTAAGTAEADAVDPYAFTEEDLDNLVSKNDKGEYVITVPEIFYTGGDEALQKVLEGKPVETTGQAMEETTNNESGSRMRIFRLYMECCAADARPLSVPVEFDGAPPAFKEMRWYTVHGTMSFEKSGEFTVPVIKATELIETEPEDGNPFYDKNGQ